jgi:hypothetical protein
MGDLMYLSITERMNGGETKRLDEIIEKYKHLYKPPKG